MESELLYLTMATAFTGLLWASYLLDRLMIRGLVEAVGQAEDLKPRLRSGTS